MFYDPRVTLSHNCMLNMVVSRRGSGKSFSTLQFFCERYKEKGEQFMYLRRTHEELKAAKEKIFLALEAEGKVKVGEFIVDGDVIYHRTFNDKDEVTTKKVCGYIMSLSKARQYKSAGFPRVQWMVLDEFIDESGTYLKDEPTYLLSAIETVARLRNIKVFILGNLITKYNPYFTFFNIKFDETKEFMKSKGKPLLVHHFRAAEFAKVKKQTDFAKLVEGTEYGTFMLDNDNILDSDDFIATKKMRGKVPFCNFVFEGREMCAYHICDEEDYPQFLYIDNKKNNSAGLSVNIDERLREGYFNLKKNNPLTATLRQFARVGAIAFSDGMVKNSVQELIIAAK